MQACCMWNCRWIDIACALGLQMYFISLWRTFNDNWIARIENHTIDFWVFRMFIEICINIFSLLRPNNSSKYKTNYTPLYIFEMKWTKCIVVDCDSWRFPFSKHCIVKFIVSHSSSNTNKIENGKFCRSFCQPAVFRFETGCGCNTTIEFCTRCAYVNYYFAR